MPEHSGIFYSDLGKGFPVILIHGFCETHEIWDSFSSDLSKDYRVICLDLPGFGRSRLLSDGFSIADVATKVHSLLEAIKINECIVIGHSLGGYVALAMADQHPEILNAFGLFHSTAYPDSEEKKISRNKVIEFASTHGVAPFVESFIPPLFYDQSNPHIQTLVKLASGTKQETLIAYVKAMRDRPDRTKVLHHFKHPILFITGEKDGGITPDSVKKQANLSSNVTLHMLPEVAHVGMFEDRKTTLKQVQEFLKKVVS
jgi:pimeloyl-ACP methyl ester carboxylesterase